MLRSTKFFRTAGLLLGTSFVVAASCAAPAESPTAPSAFSGDNLYRTSINLGEQLTPSIRQPLATSAEELPAAPDTLLASVSSAPSIEFAAAPAPPQSDRIAAKYEGDIPEGWQAQPLSKRDKFIFGLRDIIAPFSFVEYVASASYSHITNGQPNYGTNSEAFGQRFGAAVLRDATEDIFSESILSGAFHEDPRYYVMGDGHNFFKRVAYAVTRPIITRTDSGHSTLNAANIVGFAAASATTYAYYPAINQNFHDTVATYGGSFAGAAVGDVVAEFWDDAFSIFHHKK